MRIHGDGGLTTAVPVPGSPTCVVSAASSSVSAPFTVTFTFESGVTGFVVGDITVSGASLSAFSASTSALYTVTVTPTSSPSTVLISVAAGVCTDIISGGPNSASNVLSVVHDSTTPTFAITSPATSSGDFTATFTASVPVTGFVVGDITITGGTLSNFNVVSSTVYTATVSGTATGSITLQVGASVCTSFFGKANSASSISTIAFTLEYLTNIYEWWPANRGLQLDSAANPTFMVSWTGFINGYKEATSGSPLIPVSGIANFDATDGITLNTNTNPGLSGAVSVHYVIKRTSAPAGVCTLFDTNTNVPRVKGLLRISAGNSHLGFSYNGVTYDSGIAFPYDTSFHVLSFCFDGANNQAKIWLDNVEISTHTITGGPIAANTGQNLALFKSVSGTENFGGSWTGVRIYNEYNSTTALHAIHLGAFTQKVVDNTIIHLIIESGQSNNGPPTADNLITNYSPELRNGFTTAKLWNFVSNNNVFINIPANTNVYNAGSSQLSNGPFLRMLYNTLQRFPGEEIRFVEYYIAATSLEVTWNPFSGTSAFDTLLAHCTRSIATLAAEERNVVGKTFLWIQGEADAGDLTMANDYYTNLVQLCSRMRTTVGSDLRIIISKLTTRATGTGKEPYGATVTQAQLDFVALDPTNNKLVDTDNPQIDYTMVGGNVHYAVSPYPGGIEKIGETAATFVI